MVVEPTRVDLQNALPLVPVRVHDHVHFAILKRDMEISIAFDVMKIQ